MKSVCLLVTLLAVEDLTQTRGWALVLDELLHRLAQHLLLFGKIEIHWALLLSAAASRGSPRPRSAMTLRWMLAVPPAIAIPSEYMYWPIQA